VSEQHPAEPSFAGWMGSMWLYTILRFGLFFALWGILVLVGLRGFVAPVVALVLSVPLSFVLLARPRARFAQQLEARVNARRVERQELDSRLEPGERDDGV
jgi:O-antigen ligase